MFRPSVLLTTLYAAGYAAYNISCPWLPQVSFLGITGGTNVKVATQRMLDVIFTNELAKQFSFMGRGAKHGFAHLELKSVLNGEKHTECIKVTLVRFTYF